jgi:hypothetical protein
MKEVTERGIYLLERATAGTYAVYGDTDKTRVFSNRMLCDRKDFSGIAIKIATPAGQYWLVRALGHEEEGLSWQSSMDLAAKSRVAGGQAFLGSPDQLFAMFDKRHCINRMARTIRGSQIGNKSA